jgi:hypothetical protein
VQNVCVVRCGVLGAIGGVALLSVVRPLNAETAAFPQIPTVQTQLTVSPGPRPPASSPGPRPPESRPAPAARPAPPRSVPRPAPPPAAPTPPPDQALREANEQIIKQLGDLAKVVDHLSAQSDNLASQVISLSVIVSDLKTQQDDLKTRLTDTEARLKGEIDSAAAKPFQGAELGGVIDRAIGTHMDHLLQTTWPNIATPTALFLILCALFGTMIIGVPMNAILRRVPRPRVDS